MFSAFSCCQDPGRTASVTVDEIPINVQIPSHVERDPQPRCNSLDRLGDDHYISGKLKLNDLDDICEDPTSEGSESANSPVRKGTELPAEGSRTFFLMSQESLEVLKVTSSGDELSSQLAHIEVLIGQFYDIISAGRMIDQLEKPSLRSGSEAWKAFESSAIYAVYARRLKFFHDVGKSCCNVDNSWLQAFANTDHSQTIHFHLDPHNPSTLKYRVRAVIPAKLTSALLVANEVQFMAEWNKLVVKEPQVMGRRTAHYMVLNYQMSILAGMFKVDVLSEIRRFSDVNNGFVAEYIRTVEEDSTSYVKPASGYKRPHTQLTNIWAACGPNHTVLIQVGSLQLPFSVSPWVVSKVGHIAGNKIIGGLVKNSLMATIPGNRWEAAFKEDKFGLYGRVEECVASEASLSRAPQSASGTVGEFDLSPCFESPIPRT